MIQLNWRQEAVIWHSLASCTVSSFSVTNGNVLRCASYAENSSTYYLLNMTAPKDTLSKMQALHLPEKISVTRIQSKSSIYCNNHKNSQMLTKTAHQSRRFETPQTMLHDNLNIHSFLAQSATTCHSAHDLPTRTAHYEAGKNSVIMGSVSKTRTKSRMPSWGRIDPWLPTARSREWRMRTAAVSALGDGRSRSQDCRIRCQYRHLTKKHRTIVYVRNTTEQVGKGATIHNRVWPSTCLKPLNLQVV